MHPQAGAVGHSNGWYWYWSVFCSQQPLYALLTKKLCAFDGRSYGLLPQLLPLGRRWRESQTPLSSRKRSSLMKSSAWQLPALNLKVTAILCNTIPLLMARGGSQVVIGCRLLA